MRREEHPLIFFREGAAGRRPALLGTRLDVAEVIETIRQNDGSAEQAAEYLEVPLEQVEACIGYYADYREDIDAWLQRAKAVAQRHREHAERRRQAMVDLVRR